MAFIVSATSLNLRADPRITRVNRIATLPQGHEVEKVADGPPGWWRVTTRLNGAVLSGFVASQFLTERDNASLPTATSIAAVHLQENRADVTRNVTTGRAFPLGEPGRPQRNGATQAARIDQLHEIVGYLDVERNARYRATTGATYCNIYTYDFSYLAGTYLPRVWWTAGALNELRAGRVVRVTYDDTVRELNANALYDWVRDFGGDFGWRRVQDQEALQQAANAGGVGLICAQRRDLNRSGHICVVVPERLPNDTAKRVNGDVQLPLQSQAGSRNFCYSCGHNRWWAGEQFRAFGFWVHD